MVVPRIGGGVPSAQIDPFPIIAGFLGGLALFLFGVDRLSRALTVVGGAAMTGVIGRATSNRITGALTGAGVTAIIQSSSVTSVLVVSFVSAGAMTLTQAIPVIFGANVGTTATAFLASIDLGTWVYLLIAVGFVMSMAKPRERLVQTGAAIASLGIVFLGLRIIQDAMVPLRTHEPVLDLLSIASDAPLVGIVVGALFTMVVQSSSAASGVAVLLAGQGVLSLEAGIAIVLGANIGTSFTAVLAAIGKPLDARRVAAAHVLFNVAGVVIWVWFIAVLARLSMELAHDAARQLAIANTLFNVGNMLLFLPLVGVSVAVVSRVVPERGARLTTDTREPLDQDLIRTPPLALGVAWRECHALAELLHRRFQGLLTVLSLGEQRSPGPPLADNSRRFDELLDYIAGIGGRELDADQRRALLAVATTAHQLQTMDEVVRNELAPLAQTLGRQLGRTDPVVSYADLVGQALAGVVAALGAAGAAPLDPDQANGALEPLHRSAHAVVGMQLIASGAAGIDAYLRVTEFLDGLDRIVAGCRTIVDELADIASGSPEGDTPAL
ncbi:MAG: hypothetical protein DCC58_02300 [Chloroflexi bacterium]|nr:MAG: hypothetical protein DCC58_02300 [Chloroflexota bacterium]